MNRKLQYALLENWLNLFCFFLFIYLFIFISIAKEVL